jgi:hypothetical protein
MHTTNQFRKGDPRAVRRACMRVRDRVGLMICQQCCRKLRKGKGNGNKATIGGVCALRTRPFCLHIIRRSLRIEIASGNRAVRGITGLATVERQTKCDAQRQVGVVVCDGKEVDEACEQRGCVGVHSGDDTRSSAQAHTGGGCYNIVWRDVRKEITQRVGGTWSV